MIFEDDNNNNSNKLKKKKVFVVKSIRKPLFRNKQSICGPFLSNNYASPMCHLRRHRSICVKETALFRGDAFGFDIAVNFMRYSYG